ncbi:MAG: hypothetical protein E7Z84_09255 [Methanosphaera stadtmanae]|nr:hypothetical protein [Methanosphaera stadtmanae]
MKFKKSIKINENNNIESIIEMFQQLGSKYNVDISKLEKGIQYQTNDMKITQTYKTTLFETKKEDIIEKLKDKGKITIIVIDNLKKKNKKMEKKIDENIKIINDMENVKTQVIKEEEIFKTIHSLIEEAYS